MSTWPPDRPDPSSDQPSDPDETRPLAASGPDDQPTWAPYQPPFEPRDEPPAHVSPQPPPPSYGGPVYPPAPAPYGQAPFGPGAYPQSHSGATTSMTLGIISTVAAVAAPFLCCLSLPITLTGPFAIGTAIKAQREIDRQPGVYRNRANATAGLVTGIIGTVIGLLLFGLLTIVFSWDFARVYE